MFIDNLINKFGYSEMYEWSELFKFDIVPFGRFVTFDTNSYGKIKLVDDDNDFIVGVTTINSLITSDDPEEWQGKYLCNEFGDILLHEKEYVKAENTYDDVEELPYVKTLKDIKLEPVVNESYNKDLIYKKRSDRYEWIRVNLLGKCIVVDDGTCESGKWCKPSKDGIATLCNTDVKNKYYVIGRLTENTILIFFK